MPTNTFFLEDSYNSDIGLHINLGVLKRIYTDNISSTDELNVNFAFITDSRSKADRFSIILKSKFPTYQDIQVGPYDELYEITGITEKIKMHISDINEWNKIMWAFGYAYDCKLDGWFVEGG
ncbi:MAG: ribonuclease E inhibitor RraB [Nitrosopumilus sp.]|nr:ribonuclease E inhibitor RraB [Nitrosopumilus sp.]